MNLPLSPNGWHGPFEVHHSAAVLQEIKLLHQQALAEGIVSRFFAALHVILAHLNERARDFGEPLFDYHHLNLQLRVAVVSCVAVQYAVHALRPIVYLRKFVLLS